jgi:hypothetical protein
LVITPPLLGFSTRMSGTLRNVHVRFFILEKSQGAPEADLLMCA